MLSYSQPQDKENDKLLAIQKKKSNKSCPPICHEEINKRSNTSSQPNQLHEASSPCDISDLASSMPVWIEDEEADCIVDCDEWSADIYENSVHPENIPVFRAQAVAFLERHLV